MPEEPNDEADRSRDHQPYIPDIERRVDEMYPTVYGEHNRRIKELEQRITALELEIRELKLKEFNRRAWGNE